MDESQYDEAFSEKVRVEALRVALDTRKFEIELYWKRATYFWTFIAAAFVAYGTVLSTSSNDKLFLSFFVSCLGLILSLGWVLANRGSKQWQENWEHHVDHLENKVVGPLFKTTLPRGKPEGLCGWIDFLVSGPSKYSVSKINQLISMYITVMWLILVLRSPQSWEIWTWHISNLAVLGVTIIMCIALFTRSRTYLGPQYHYAHLRESHIQESKE